MAHISGIRHVNTKCKLTQRNSEIKLYCLLININRCVFFPVGVEVSQGVGGLCEMLPEDEASVVQRSPAAAAGTADQRV